MTKQYNAITGLVKGLTTNNSQGIYLDNTIYFFDGLPYNRFLGNANVHVRVRYGAMADPHTMMYFVQHPVAWSALDMNRLDS